MSNIDFRSPTSVAIVMGFGTVALCCIGASSFAVWKVLQDARREKIRKSKAAIHSQKKRMSMVQEQSMARASRATKASPGEDNSPTGSDAEEVASQDSDVEAQQSRTKSTKSARRIRFDDDDLPANPMALPKQKTHHYYLSYEKAHSRNKKIPERLAQELYDALLLQGFSGYKNYADTNKQSVTNLKSSCTVVAMLHDEVFAGRCVMQWQVAKQDGIPIIFVLDRTRGNFMNEMQEEMADIDPEMLDCKWIEYVDGGNAECANQVAEWMKTALRAPKANAMGRRTSVTGKRSNVTAKPSNVSGFSHSRSVLPGQPDTGSSSSEEIAIDRCHVIDEKPDDHHSQKKTRLMKRIESRKKKKGSR